MRVAVLRNLSSSRNRVAKIQPYPKGIEPIELTGISKLPGLLKDLKNDHVECLVIDGGDGTVREVITCLPEVFEFDLPVLGILPQGNINLIARNVGALKGPASLAKLLMLSKDEVLATLHETPMLRLDFQDVERRSLRGFMMGWGAYASATKLATNNMTSKGARQVLSVFARMLKKTFFEGPAGDLRKGVLADLTKDGQILTKGNRFIGLATTLRGPLTAGLNPFWGKGEGTIRWTDVLSPAPFLLPAALIAVTGRHMNWMKKSGYHSGFANKLDLTIDAPLVLDGEFVSVNRPQTISINSDESVRFISI